jgi:hypothetical protein
VELVLILHQITALVVAAALLRQALMGLALKQAMAVLEPHLAFPVRL